MHMKKVFLSLAFLALFAFSATISVAQIQTPAPSPFCKLEQTVGLTKVTIEYSRPGVKGRELFVDVEKWGQMWRTGANAATKITFSDDVKIEGQDVPKGTYAIYSIPGKETWTTMLYSDPSLGGNVGGYDTSKETVRFTSKTNVMPVSMENFAFMIDNMTPNSADIWYMWGNYAISFGLEVEVENKVMAAIEKTMAGPGRNDYYQAARYYYNTDKDLKQALTWAKKANEIGERYWQLRLEAQINYKLGDHNRALAKIARSSEVARSGDNPNNNYAEANDKMAAEWRMKEAGKETPDSEGGK